MNDEFEMPEPQNEDGGSSLETEFLAASVKAMLLVAFINGRPHWNTREALIETVWVATQHSNQHSNAEAVLRFLDKSAELLEDFPESTWSGFFESAQGLPGEAKRILLGTCMRLAFADGHLTPSESHLIHQIADWIDIDRQNREVWKTEVRSALTSGKARGGRYTGIENLDWENESLK